MLLTRPVCLTTNFYQPACRRGEVRTHEALINLIVGVEKATPVGRRWHGVRQQRWNVGLIPCWPSHSVAKCFSLPAIPANAPLYHLESADAGRLHYLTQICAKWRNSVPSGPKLRQTGQPLRRAGSPGGVGVHDRRVSRRPRDGEARHGREAAAPGTPTGREARPEGFGVCESPVCDDRAVALVRHVLLEGDTIEVCEYHARRAVDLGARRLEVVSA
jgi:hypothetical protein